MYAEEGPVSPLLGDVLDAFESPAFLLRPDGTVLHANPSARAAFPEPPSWLAEALREGGTRTHLREVRRIAVDGAELILVVPRVPHRRPSALAAFQDLPSYLARVAELLAEGKSDKEISAELESVVDHNTHLRGPLPAPPRLPQPTPARPARGSAPVAFHGRGRRPPLARPRSSVMLGPCRTRLSTSTARSTSTA